MPPSERTPAPRKRAATLRLFVAVYPPPQVAQALLEMLPSLDLPPHRPVPPDQVHLTLQFIGDTPAGQLDETVESVRRATGGIGSFELTLLELIALPRRGPARLVAAEADRPAALLELQRRLAQRLARAPRRRAGDRFLPHFTLCRFRAPRRVGPLEHRLGIDPFAVRQIALMRSTLLPEGARHDAVASCGLG